ncbi:hypothetical protein TRFO_04110 [Tritrichomonas foetus]|uniref:Uncharacterized protein n=1 Tax=Tritrichomonas foetus TaxID=1144522 RepID=A0A1J4KGU1_9EUKA|nr:hypothetical protein TRFO_04110 [Tritrichomonas foetus]|eukprot:OHT10623.1 hypothetical protein TRFO_04110 [Tritrichomonas foetus]
MNLILFLVFVNSECDINITSALGIHKVDQELEYGKSMCINITYYPFYIAFYDISPNVRYNEYYSRSKDRKNPKDFTAVGSELVSSIIFRAIELPYGSITLTAHEPSSRLRFIYFSMPGLCQTGIYFSNTNFEEISLMPLSSSSLSLLSTSGLTNFTRLRNFDDKCFVYVPPHQTTVKFSQTSKDPTDQFFIYKNFTDYQAFAGTFSTKEVTYNENESFLLRILTNGDITPEKVTISVESKESIPSGVSKFFIPRHKEPECEIVFHWYSEELIIALLACCGFFLVLSVIIIMFKCIDRCRHGNGLFRFHSLE